MKLAEDMKKIKFVLIVLILSQTIKQSFGQIEVENKIISDFIHNCFNQNIEDSILKVKIGKIRISRNLLFIDETRSSNLKISMKDMVKYIERHVDNMRLNNLDFDLFSDFLQRNKERIPIDTINQLKGKLRFVSNDECQEVFEKGGWANYYKNYGMSSLVRISRPGLNSAKNIAIIECSNILNGLVGISFYAIMNKTNGKWTVIEIKIVTIS